MSKTLIIVLAVLLISGCAAVPPPLGETAGPDMPASFTSSAENLPAEPGRFWERFGDPDLNRLVGQALDGNLSIHQALARREQFTALEKISRAGVLPMLNLGAQVGRDRQLTSMGTSTGNSTRLSVAASYEVDLWGKLDSQRDAAAFRSAAGNADLKSAYITVAANVTDLYFLLIEQRAQLDLNDQIIKSQADTLTRMERRYEAGLVPTLDVYLARQNIIASRSQRPVIQAALSKGEHAMAALLGRFPRREPAGNIRELPELSDPPAVGLPSELLTRRPDLEAALLRIKALNADLAAAIADRYPSFNLSAVLGRSSLDYATSITGTLWSLLLEAGQPIFDNGLRKSQTDHQQALLKEALAGYHQVVIQAVKEVEDALIGCRTSRRQIELIKERLAATTSTLRLAEDQYFAGLTDYLLVLTAQKNHFEVQGQLINARRQLISEQISLMRALGGDWPKQLIDESRSVTD